MAKIDFMLKLSRRKLYYVFAHCGKISLGGAECIIVLNLNTTIPGYESLSKDQFSNGWCHQLPYDTVLPTEDAKVYIFVGKLKL